MDPTLPSPPPPEPPAPRTVRVTLHGRGPDITALGIFLEAVTRGYNPAGVLAKLKLTAITITGTRGSTGRGDVMTMTVELRENPGRDVTVRSLREALGLPELPPGKDGQLHATCRRSGTLLLVTVLEMRAMLGRVNARLLREDAGIRQLTVAEALGVPTYSVYAWESGKCEPKCEAGYKWLRVIAGLERHAIVTAEIAAVRDKAA